MLVKKAPSDNGNRLWGIKYFPPTQRRAKKVEKPNKCNFDKITLDKQIINSTAAGVVKTKCEHERNQERNTGTDTSLISKAAYRLGWTFARWTGCPSCFGVLRRCYPVC